jgi:hypothetical protein
MIKKALFVVSVLTALASLIILIDAYNANQVLLGICLFSFSVVFFCIAIINEQREEIQELYNYINNNHENPA